MSSESRFLSSNLSRVHPIEVQCLDDSSTGRADADDDETIPSEVKPPRVASRIEQRNVLTGSRIDRGLPRAFAQRTRDARKSEIAQFGFSRSVQGDNVIDVEGRFLPSLIHAAVFASIPCALNDMRSKMRWYEHGATKRGYSDVVRAIGSAKGLRRDQRVLQPLVALRRLNVCPDPAYRAASEGVFPRLLAVGTSPSHRATQARTEFVCSYSLSRSSQKLPSAEHLVQTLILSTPKHL